MEINERLLKNEKLSSLMNVFKSEIERLEMLRKSLATGPEGYVDQVLRGTISRMLDRAKKDFSRINLTASELSTDPDESLIQAFTSEIIESITEIKLTFSKLRYQK